MKKLLALLLLPALTNAAAPAPTLTSYALPAYQHVIDADMPVPSPSALVVDFSKMNRSELLTAALACWEQLNKHEQQIHTNALEVVKNKSKESLGNIAIASFPKEIIKIIVDYAIYAGAVPSLKELIVESVPMPLVDSIGSEVANAGKIITEYMPPFWPGCLRAKYTQREARLCNETLAEEGFDVIRSAEAEGGEKFRACKECNRGVHYTYCSWTIGAWLHASNCSRIVDAKVNGKRRGFEEFPDDLQKLKDHLAFWMFDSAHRNKHWVTQFEAPEENAIMTVREGISNMVDMLPFILEQQAKLKAQQ